MLFLLYLFACLTVGSVLYKNQIDGSRRITPLRVAICVAVSGAAALCSWCDGQYGPSSIIQNGLMALELLAITDALVNRLSGKGRKSEGKSEEQRTARASVGRLCMPRAPRSFGPFILEWSWRW
jgi:hypothetical protein